MSAELVTIDLTPLALDHAGPGGVGVPCCDEREASCLCRLPIAHEGAHECDCGGSWYFDEAGEFHVVSWPS